MIGAEAVGRATEISGGRGDVAGEVFEYPAELSMQEELEHTATIMNQKSRLREDPQLVSSVLTANNDAGALHQTRVALGRAFSPFHEVAAQQLKLSLEIETIRGMRRELALIRSAQVSQTADGLRSFPARN